MIRLYLNLTNFCNENCEFCCMYSSPQKRTFISKEKFVSIINKYDEDFELQLEGGEPTTHPSIFDFLDIAMKTGRCVKVTVDTNGKLLHRYFDKFQEFSDVWSVPVTLKISLNYWLYAKNPNLFCEAARYLERAKRKVTVHFNVRLRKDVDEHMRQLVQDFGLGQSANVFYLQSYGLLSGNVSYDPPVIVQNIRDWYLYASDGTEFHSTNRAQDLVDRSEYERRLP